MLLRKGDTLQFSSSFIRWFQREYKVDAYTAYGLDPDRPIDVNGVFQDQDGNIDVCFLNHELTRMADYISISKDGKFRQLSMAGDFVGLSPYKPFVRIVVRNRCSCGGDIINQNNSLVCRKCRRDQLTNWVNNV